MVGTNKNFRRKLKAPARNDQEVFMAIKTHLALSSSFDLHVCPGGVVFWRKKREIKFWNVRKVLCSYPDCNS